MTLKSLLLDQDKRTLRWTAWALMMGLLLVLNPLVKAQSGGPHIDQAQLAESIAFEVHNLGDCTLELYLINDQEARIPLGQVAPQDQRIAHDESVG